MTAHTPGPWTIDWGHTFEEPNINVFIEAMGAKGLVGECVAGEYSYDGDPLPCNIKLRHKTISDAHGVKRLEPDIEEMRANALLIASAPFLLTVLRAVAANIEAFSNDHHSDNPTDVTLCLPVVLAAIAEAEGRADAEAVKKANEVEW